MLFVPLLGTWPLFDWDELMPAESTREMLLTGNYRMVQIDFQPFYEKPPLFFWIQALSMKVFGVNELGARFPNAVVGIATMLLLYNIGKLVFKESLGVLWALLMVVGVMPQFYFRSGFMHPMYDLFTFISVYYLFKLSSPDEFSSAKQQRKNRWAWMFASALFAGLAALVKGPACIVIIILTSTVYLIVHKGKLKIELSEMLGWWLILALIIFSWLGIELYDNGTRFIDGFSGFYKKLIGTNAEGHGGPVFYYVIVMLIGFFPAAWLAFDSFKKVDADSDTQIHFKRWMIYLFLTNLIVFSLAKTKIVHYASLCGYPLTFLAAYYLHQLWEGKFKWTWKQTVPVVFMAIVFTVAVIGAQVLAPRRHLLLPYLHDEFAAACLMAPVYFHQKEMWLGIFFLLSVIVSVLLMQTKHLRWGTYILLISSAVFFNTLLIRWVPRAERFSQHALIEFMQQKRNENCVIETDFRGYAHLFYTNKQPGEALTPDKTYYKVARIQHAQGVLNADTTLTELYRKNGWVFMKRTD